MDTVMELEIGPGPEPGSYVVHVLRSVGGGEPIQTIRLDLDDLVERRPLLEATVLSSSVSARRVMSDTEAVLQDVGRRLFESTFSDDVGTAYRTSMAVASERGTGVQISLRLMAPGLAALPWESLFDVESGTYLCRKEPLVRHVPAPHSPAALSIEPPMRVLGMVSSPRGLPALDVAGERERLEEALHPHLESGRVVLEWLDEVTWTAVHERLLKARWHVLHFVGHGSYDTETDEGVLAFVGRDGRAEYVTASSLADLLDEAEPTPRLVVLNSCQSGAGGTTDLFSGTAAALAHSGIRAVAAMQFSISDPAAIEFARGFYTALAYGRGIDEAVRSGRIGILGLGHGTLEWVTPVLYLRGEDTQLFDVRPMPEVAEAGDSTSGSGLLMAPAEPAAELSPSEELTDEVAEGPVEGGDAEEVLQAEPPPPPVSEVVAADTPSHIRSLAAPETPWWNAATAPNSAPAPPPPPPPRSGSGGKPMTSPRPPAEPPDRRPPGPRSHRPVDPRRRPASRWKPWAVVTLVAVVAIAGALALVSTLRPQPGAEDTSAGEVADPIDAAPGDRRTMDDGVSAVFVTEVTVPLTLDDWRYTEVSCEVGVAYRITATSEDARHDGSPVGPEGLTEGESNEAPFYTEHPLASLLVGVRGSDDLEFVGAETTYQCPSAGEIKVGVNDYQNLGANSGQFRAALWMLSGQ